MFSCKTVITGNHQADDSLTTIMMEGVAQIGPMISECLTIKLIKTCQMSRVSEEKIIRIQTKTLGVMMKLSGKLIFSPYQQARLHCALLTENCQKLKYIQDRL